MSAWPSHLWSTSDWDILTPGPNFGMQGVLDGAGFPAVVSAHFVPIEGQQRPRTTILIKFAEEVIELLLDFIEETLFRVCC